MSLRSILAMSNTSTPKKSTHFADFFNGSSTAVPRNAGLMPSSSAVGARSTSLIEENIGSIPFCSTNVEPTEDDSSCLLDFDESIVALGSIHRKTLNTQDMGGIPFCFMNFEPSEEESSCLRKADDSIVKLGPVSSKRIGRDFYRSSPSISIHTSVFSNGQVSASRKPACVNTPGPVKSFDVSLQEGKIPLGSPNMQDIDTSILEIGPLSVESAKGLRKAFYGMLQFDLSILNHLTTIVEVDDNDEPHGLSRTLGSASRTKEETDEAREAFDVISGNEDTAVHASQTPSLSSGRHSTDSPSTMSTLETPIFSSDLPSVNACSEERYSSYPSEDHLSLVLKLKPDDRFEWLDLPATADRDDVEDDFLDYSTPQYRVLKPRQSRGGLYVDEAGTICSHESGQAHQPSELSTYLEAVDSQDLSPSHTETSDEGEECDEGVSTGTYRVHDDEVDNIEELANGDKKQDYETREIQGENTMIDPAIVLSEVAQPGIKVTSFNQNVCSQWSAIEVGEVCEKISILEPADEQDAAVKDDTVIANEDAHVPEDIPHDQGSPDDSDKIVFPEKIVAREAKYDQGAPASLATSTSQPATSLKGFDLTEVFGLDDDYESLSYAPPITVTPASPLPPSAPVSGQAASFMSLNLRPHLDEDTIKVVNDLNNTFNQIWEEGQADGPWIKVRDEDEVKALAVELLEADSNKEFPIALINDYNAHFWKIWGEGHLRKPEGPWVPGQDEPKVQAIAIKYAEWNLMIEASKQLRPTTRLRPGSMLLQAARSSSDWVWEMLGGDAQYHDARCVEALEYGVAMSKSGKELGRSVHHINFNGEPVYERCYTPPAVSFWAAATTFYKVLFPKVEELPTVHRAKVLTSQAFKYVDPTLYAGDDKANLWTKQGSRLRNAATSDVQVAYEPIGTWNLDEFTVDDVAPGVVSAEDGDCYEHAMNGHYKFSSFQLPYYMSNYWGDHNLYNLNDNPRSIPRHIKVMGYKKCPSPLHFELCVSDGGALWQQHWDLGANWACLEGEYQSQAPHDTSIEPPTASVEDEANKNLTATEPADGDFTEDTDLKGEEDPSEADTDIEGDAVVERESIHYQQSRAAVANQPQPAVQEDIGASFIAQAEANMAKLKEHIIATMPNASVSDESLDEEEPEDFFGDNGITDHESVWPLHSQPSSHPKADLLARFADDDAQSDPLNGSYQDPADERTRDLLIELHRNSILTKFSENRPQVLSGECKYSYGDRFEVKSELKFEAGRLKVVSLKADEVNPNKDELSSTPDGDEATRIILTGKSFDDDNVFDSATQEAPPLSQEEMTTMMRQIMLIPPTKVNKQLTMLSDDKDASGALQVQADDLFTITEAESSPEKPSSSPSSPVLQLCKVSKFAKVKRNISKTHWPLAKPAFIEEPWNTHSRSSSDATTMSSQDTPQTHSRSSSNATELSTDDHDEWMREAILQAEAKQRGISAACIADLDFADLPVFPKTRNHCKADTPILSRLLDEDDKDGSQVVEVAEEILDGDIEPTEKDEVVADHVPLESPEEPTALAKSAPIFSICNYTVADTPPSPCATVPKLQQSSNVEARDILESESYIELRVEGVLTEGDVVEAKNLVEVVEAENLVEYADVTDIPFRPYFDEHFYPHIALSVGHAAFELGKWVCGRWMW